MYVYLDIFISVFNCQLLPSASKRIGSAVDNLDIARSPRDRLSKVQKVTVEHAAPSQSSEFMRDVPFGALDVHTHMYLPRYVDIMRKRNVNKNLPYIRKDEDGLDRLMILPGEDDEGGAGGRYIYSNYWDLDEKLEIMKKAGISGACVSLANPWLDFMLDPTEATEAARLLNNDMEDMCMFEKCEGHMWGFGVLPLADPRSAVAELDRMHTENPHLRGVIMGTDGCGKGLDDPAMDIIWEKLQALGFMCFFHPHYGVGNEKFGNYGHSLLLGLGFPFETSAAVSRLILSGVLARFPKLKLLIAHSGGTLPYLSGRLDSCCAHDEHFKLDKKPSEYLKMLYYDALCYNTESVDLLMKFAGPDRLMFGTDDPFSISDPVQVWDSLSHLKLKDRKGIVYSNAQDILGIKFDFSKSSRVRDSS